MDRTFQLARIFQSGMVLQYGKPVQFYGKTRPGAVVSVQIQGKIRQARTDSEGNFRVTAGPLHVSKKENVIIRSACMGFKEGAEEWDPGVEEIVLSNVAVGAVFITAGQSNMEFFMQFEKHFADEQPGCRNCRLRYYNVPQVAFDGQESAFDYSRTGIWRQIDEETLGGAGAVGYYFQKMLEKELDMPVGIVNCSWGGTRIMAWMDPGTVAEAGPLWLQEHETAAAGLDFDAYYEEQKHNPMNDRGSLTDNPFYRFMMPVTHTQEENMRFLAGLGELPDAADGNGAGYAPPLAPESFPGCLYEHMVRPLAGFAVQGILWYQGESDDDTSFGPGVYGPMLKGMIADWRRLWNEKLPFFIVQLPGFERWLMNENRDFRTIRRAQEETARTTDSCWLCSIGDVGEQYDIHPKDKKTVGERLALLALGHLYGKEILCDPPFLLEYGMVPGTELPTISLKFANAGTGLTFADGQELEVRADGAECTYHAEVQGDCLILTLIDAQKNAPCEVTISFAQKPYYRITLKNSADIPALPFEVSVINESRGQVQ